MSGKTVLVLGGGLGGIAAATHLRHLVATEHRVVVVERRATFSLCMANLWLMTGERSDPATGERPLSRLAESGIEWLQAEVRAIDPGARRVTTSAGDLGADYLVLALGADKTPNSFPGLAEAALNLYDPAGAQAIRRQLDSFGGGRVVVLVSRTPFSCPSAPYEAALLIDSVLRERRVRAASEVAVYTPEDQPMPVAGREVGARLLAMLVERGIEFHGEHLALKVEPGARRVLFEIDEAAFDVLVAVPPHVAPPAVRESGLTDASGWVPVDPVTLETRHSGVWAIGDVTAVRLANGMFLPKAGVFADGEARVVAESIAARIEGRDPSRRFGGEGFCYIEVGGGLAAYGAGNFYALPAPRVLLEAPSERFRREKVEIERTALAPWQHDGTT
jgi:sulfide:quinone oxidoreductase